MNRDNINKTIFWSLLYIFLYSIGAVTIVLYSPEFLMMAVGIVGVTYIIINLFFIPYKRETLFINGFVGAMSVMCIGIWFGKHLVLESSISREIGSYIIDNVLQYLKLSKFKKYSWGLIKEILKAIHFGEKTDSIKSVRMNIL